MKKRKSQEENGQSRQSLPSMKRRSVARPIRRVWAERSRIMATIRSSHTKPEIAVRKALTKLGLRYRLHAKDLPGRPDIVFRSRRIAIFVHGCFWHQHDCRRWSEKTRSSPYWRAKLKRNRARDAAAGQLLRDAGWRVVVLWECQTKNTERLLLKLGRVFGEQPGKNAARSASSRRKQSR